MRAQILNVSTFNSAPSRQRKRVQRPIGARGTSSQRWQLSRLQAMTIRSGQWEKPNTIEILSQTPFLEVNRVRSSAREATMDVTRRWQWQLSWLQDLTLSTRKIEYHSYRSMECDHQSENLHLMTRSYPWICNTENRRRSQQTIVSQRRVYTNSSSNLKEAQRTRKTTKAIERVRMAAMRKSTSHHPSPNLRTALPPILIIPTIPSRLKFMEKPVILTMKTKTKTKMIQPSQILRIIAAETTSCQWSLRTTKRRWLSRIGCYLNSNSNNKPNRRRREP